MLCSSIIIATISMVLLHHCNAFTLPSIKFTSSRPLLRNSLSMSLENSKWISATSTNSDLQVAINEILTSRQLNHDISYSTAVFFASTAYEAAAFQYDIIVDSIKTKFPSITTMLGCTVAGVIGTGSDHDSLEPIEVENRASLSVLFIASDSFKAQIRRYNAEEVEQLANTKGLPNVSSQNSGMNLILSTDAMRSSLSGFMDAISSNTGIPLSFGAFASAVNSYQKPKVFAYSIDIATSKLERYTDGLVMLSLVGDVSVNFIVAKSCVPVGPMFEITSIKNNEILSLKEFNMNPSSINEDQPPLVQLENVLNQINSYQKYGLTRELLLSSVTRSPATIASNKLETSIEKEIDFFSQKPTSFDPYTGSITLSTEPTVGGTFQFCVRDSSAARRGVTALQNTISRVLQSGSVVPSATMIFGSVERGNKVFKYQSWESLQLYHTLHDRGIDAPIAGLFTNGVFARFPLASADKYVSSIMEADSLYAIISPGSTSTSGLSTTEMSTTIGSEDVMSAFELKHFSDEDAIIAVDKSQAETSNTVRVAGLDYFVPDKMPQARFVLEELVWTRQKDSDRMKEKFPMQRALTQAKVAEGKFPPRHLHAAIKGFKGSDKGYLPVIVEIHRASIHNGRMLYDPSNMAEQMRELACASTIEGVVALGVQTDISFGGVYEDLESVKKACELPVVCNDFVVYGYQLFRAKASGADAVKLLASVLTSQEMTYLIKTAKAIGLMCIVVVASKKQLLNVLANVVSVTIISITSRNQFLWKIDSGKAHRIMNDTEVKAALSAWKGEDESRLIFTEGFGDRDELSAARVGGLVDAAILGEEVLTNCHDDGRDSSYGDALKHWLSF